MLFVEVYDVGTSDDDDDDVHDDNIVTDVNVEKTWAGVYIGKTSSGLDSARNLHDVHVAFFCCHIFF